MNIRRQILLDDSFVQEILYVPLPSLAERCEYIGKHLDQKETAISKLEISKIVATCDGLTFNELHTMLLLAKNSAIQRAMINVKMDEPLNNAIVSINNTDFQSARTKVSKSYTELQLYEYAVFEKQSAVKFSKKPYNFSFSGLDDQSVLIKYMS